MISRTETAMAPPVARGIGLRPEPASGLFDIPKIARLVPNFTEAKASALAKIEQSDLSLITDKFVDLKDASIYKIPEQVHMVKALFGDITPELAQNLERDFKRWVALAVLVPDQQIAPPNKAIDMYWHLFILHSREYRAFCTEVLGRPLSHSPTSEANETEVKDADQRTKTLIAQLFGGTSTTALLRGTDGQDGGEMKAECDSGGGWCSTCQTGGG